jgi:hypothetical protein
MTTYGKALATGVTRGVVAPDALRRLSDICPTHDEPQPCAACEAAAYLFVRGVAGIVLTVISTDHLRVRAQVGAWQSRPHATYASLAREMGWEG